MRPSFLVALVAELRCLRLAYPGLWWRVTIIALIMCGHGPEVGSVMWKEHPTLRALVKMVTSMRFRFPTVDCDDLDREMMKQKEQEARDEVGTRIGMSIEIVFILPADLTMVVV